MRERSNRFSIESNSNMEPHRFSFSISCRFRRNSPPLCFEIKQPEGWLMFRGNEYDLSNGMGAEPNPQMVLFRENVPSGTYAATMMIGVAYRDPRESTATLLRKIKSTMKHQANGRIIKEEFTTLANHSAFMFMVRIDGLPGPDGQLHSGQSLNAGIEDGVLLWTITCMASQDNFHKYEDMFRSSINTFRIIDGPDLQKLREEMERIAKEPLEGVEE